MPSASTEADAPPRTVPSKWYDNRKTLVLWAIFCWPVAAVGLLKGNYSKGWKRAALAVLGVSVLGVVVIGVGGRHGQQGVPSIRISAKDPVAMSRTDIDQEIASITRQQADVEARIMDMGRASYQITAEVKSKDGTTLTLWGKAFSQSGELIQDGVLLEDGNIVVRDADLDKINGTYYINSGWFIGKTTGRNGFGASVPVHVYGPAPSSFALLQGQDAALSARLEALSAEKQRKIPPEEKARNARLIEMQEARQREAQEVAAGFSITKESAGEDSFLAFLLDLGQAHRLITEGPPHERITEIQYDNYRDNTLVELGKHPVRILLGLTVGGPHDSGYGVFQYRTNHYEASVPIGRKGDVLYGATPVTFPLGTVGWKKVLMDPSKATIAWKAEMNDAVFAFGKAVDAVAQSSKNPLYVVFPIEGTITSQSFNRELEFTVNDAEPFEAVKLYDEDFHEVRLNESLTTRAQSSADQQ